MTPRILSLLALVLGLAACSTDVSDGNKRDLGDFVLGHNIVVAPEIVKGPLSREASTDDWIASVKGEVQKRVGRYDGDRMVHLGINVGGYVLAQPGIPLVFAPKSALVLLVTAWDDEAGGKFHDKPYQLSVTEAFSAKGMLGSGNTQSAEEQMANLSKVAAEQIEIWLSQHAECMRDDTRGEAARACWTRVDKEIRDRRNSGQ
ncbi:hypothetical protein [Shimia biformata]|uniref:hypothetical protein n=1 Tax=Shimia biformata TaxID=1294299 RepID=UPI00194E8677|nr:hypothetical protein [Shimia biformata]